MNIINNEKTYKVKLNTENIEQDDEIFLEGKQIYFIADDLSNIFEDLETDSGAEHDLNSRAAWITFNKDKNQTTITFLHSSGCYNIPYAETFKAEIEDSELEALLS